MWIKIILVIIALSLATAIRVPVDTVEENERPSASIAADKSPSEPVYYNQDDVKLGTYLIPPEPQRQEELILDDAVAPATYLLPPSIGKQSDYHYEGTGTDQQTDWYPIAQLSQNPPEIVPIILPELNETEAIKILERVRNGKYLQHERFAIPSPSTVLEPPAPNALNDYLVPDEPNLPINGNPSLKLHESSEQRRPIFNTDQNILNHHPHSVHKQRFIDQEQTPHIGPHKLIPYKYKLSTKLYPKKYTEGFKPVPIPVSQFADDSSDEIPRARPLKPFHPILSAKGEYLSPPDNKKVNYYEQFEKKQKLKDDNSAEKHQHSTADNPYDDNKSSSEEQQTSESHLRYPERNVYTAPLRQEPQLPVEQKNKHPPPPAGERTEFRMHGMKGPHSYQFGYDTGKGKNRQFRYEERDNDGHVRGHYGYMDRNGKLRVVNYDADPEHGFRASVPVEKEQ